MGKRADSEQQARERKQAREKSDAERVRREGMRDSTAAAMREKADTIARFVVERRAEDYPIDSTAAAEEVTMGFGGPPRMALERVLRPVLGESAGTVAQALLTSIDPEHSCDVGRLPPLAATADRLLAHVEILRLGLDQATAATVARRAALVLLSRGEPAPAETTVPETQPRTVPPFAEHRVAAVIQELATNTRAAYKGLNDKERTILDKRGVEPQPALSMCIACGADLAAPPVITNATAGLPCSTCGRELPVPAPTAPPATAEPTAELPPAEEPTRDYGFKPGPTLVLDFTHGHGVRLGSGPKFERIIDWTTDPPSLMNRNPEDRRRAKGYARTKCAMTFQDTDGPATVAEGTVVELVDPNDWENEELGKYAKGGLPHIVIRWRARARFVAMRDIERADDSDWRRQLKRGNS